MKKAPAVYEVTVDDSEWVTMRIPRGEAAVMARVILEAADRYCISLEERRRMRSIARTMKRKLFPPPPPRYIRSMVARPTSMYRNDIDIDYVVSSSAPYPVLSVRDMRTAYPLLEAKGLSAAEISRRLHVTARTVVRWREATARKEKEKRDAQKHEVGDC